MKKSVRAQRQPGKKSVKKEPEGAQDATKAGTKSSSQARRSRRKSRGQSWKVIHPHAAGIDVGATGHYVAVPPQCVEEGKSNVHCYGAYTRDLDELVEWLKSCAVTTVAMESTGVYWIALYQKIEAAGIEALLVNAREVKNVPGRKTDVTDCQWLQQLHSYGLLRGSFRPADSVCRLRTLVRHRSDLIAQASCHVLHMQKALQQMNIHLHHAVSDLTGESGLRILDAILAGERDPAMLTGARDSRVKKTTVEEMRAALQGDWRSEHLFVLGQSLEAWRFCHRQIEDCDKQIEAMLASWESAQPNPEQSNASDVCETNPPAQSPARKKARQSRRRNAPKFDVAGQLKRICGIDLTQAAGLQILSVLVIIAEIGLDMSRWRSAKAFCSWLGLCPNNKISGGRGLSSRTRKVVNRAANALRLGAFAMGKTDSCLGSFYRRMKARLGPTAATTATARKLACIVYTLLKEKREYTEPDLAAYEERINRQRIARLTKQAAALGYDLVEKQQIAA
jgi:transposase